MNFEEFQKNVKREYPAVGRNILFPTLQLNAAVGKVTGRITRVVQQGKTNLATRELAAIQPELREVLEGLANLCSELGINMQFVAQNQEE